MPGWEKSLQDWFVKWGGTDGKYFAKKQLLRMKKSWGGRTEHGGDIFSEFKAEKIIRLREQKGNKADQKGAVAGGKGHLFKTLVAGKGKLLWH